MPVTPMFSSACVLLLSCSCLVGRDCPRRLGEYSLITLLGFGCRAVVRALYLFRFTLHCLPFSVEEWFSKLR